MYLLIIDMLLLYSPICRSQQKEVTTLGDSFSNFPVPLLEKISQDNTMMDRLSQQNSMKEKLSQENTMVVELLEDKTMRETASQRVDSSQIPCLSVPSQVGFKPTTVTNQSPLMCVRLAKVIPI